MKEYSETRPAPVADVAPGDHAQVSPPHAEPSYAEPWLDVAVTVARDGPAGRFELDVTLGVERGAFIALTGPSGAGKTTLLRVLAGLTAPDHGRVRVGPALWCDTAARVALSVRRRSIGFVFQDYALFPNMTVQQNVQYAIGRRADRAEVQRLLQLVDLVGLAAAYPARLSGGQRQRLALIRALARRPDILMLDEPLSALDPVMRRLLQDELKRLHREFDTTTFMVSHDIAEILRLADRIIRLENGRIAADGDPARVLLAAEAHAALHGYHVSGPDAAGLSVIAIDGRLHRIRYRHPPDGLAAGDFIVIDIAQAAAWRV